MGEEIFSLKIQFGIRWYLYYSCMFQVEQLEICSQQLEICSQQLEICSQQLEICSQQLEICKSVCMFIALAIVVETD